MKTPSWLVVSAAVSCRASARGRCHADPTSTDEESLAGQSIVRSLTGQTPKRSRARPIKATRVPRAAVHIPGDS